ncbi:MAG: alpha-L-fucosidase [Planctomycetes bacterium]|nr:alpha-L-fucosidase [Planctomycetota bacterium]
MRSRGFVRIVLWLPAVLALATPARGAGGPYEPMWESLRKHRDPEWFADAKLGIYTHWGPITVATATAPSEMEWYARQMYEPDHPAFAYHRQRFGDQKTFGYKDVIPLFRAEKFDADEWADVFARAGARFAGPVAIHHDNFALWDSALTEWDSMDKGPKRDLAGELERAIRKRGMKFIATFHHGFTWRYFEPAYGYDAADPSYASLYAEPHAAGAPPSRAFQDGWLGKVNEVVTKYRPDLIWFDFGLGSVISGEHQRRMFADYYNWAAGEGCEVCVAHKHRDIHGWTGILDFERGREDRITEYVWLTDTSVGPWFHHRALSFRSLDDLVRVFVDIVSKNGCMLLNIGPDADGALPEPGRGMLLGLGEWLRVNGAAIYGTRPWSVFGEGPTRNAGGGFSEGRDQPYAPEDIRFTRTKDGKTLFAIALGWPGRELILRSVQVDRAGPDACVRMLGLSDPLRFRVDDAKQIAIDVPDLAPEKRPCRHAYAFELTGFALSLGEAGFFARPEAIELPPGAATFEGTKIQVQVNEGRPNIGFWDNAGERAHWLAWIRKPGTYMVRGEFSSAYGASGLRIISGDEFTTAAIPKTDGWFKPVFVRIGKLRFEEPGVYHLILEPADPETWKAVNVYRLQLAPAK